MIFFFAETQNCLLFLLSRFVFVSLSSPVMLKRRSSKLGIRSSKNNNQALVMENRQNVKANVSGKQVQSPIHWKCKGTFPKAYTVLSGSRNILAEPMPS